MGISSSFRSQVVAKLRDAGVILASGHHGYKLPVCVADISSFVSHADTIIGPMLHRLKLVRDQLLLASQGELDILGDPGLEYLRRLL